MKYKYMYMLFTYLSNNDVFQPKCFQYTVMFSIHSLFPGTVSLLYQPFQKLFYFK